MAKNAAKREVRNKTCAALLDVSRTTHFRPFFEVALVSIFKLFELLVGSELTDGSYDLGCG